MINNEDILVFDFDFDKSALLDFWNQNQDNTQPYSDKRFGRFVMNNWRILKDIELEYADAMCKHFDIDAIPKFYVLQADTILFPHTDQDTTCSINFLLSDGAAPVRFGENEYYYRTALLNTTRTHSVDKSPKDRILFKLSIKDEGFDIVKQKIINTISRS
jgi:hypothetical protein